MTTLTHWSKSIVDGSCIGAYYSTDLNTVDCEVCRIRGVRDSVEELLNVTTTWPFVIVGESELWLWASRLERSSLRARQTFQSFLEWARVSRRHPDLKFSETIENFLSFTELSCKASSIVRVGHLEMETRIDLIASVMEVCEKLVALERSTTDRGGLWTPLEPKKGLRYLLFSCTSYYPTGGMNDCFYKTDDVNEAQSKAKVEYEDTYNHVTIYDTLTGEYVPTAFDDD